MPMQNCVVFSQNWTIEDPDRHSFSEFNKLIARFIGEHGAGIMP